MSRRQYHEGDDSRIRVALIELRHALLLCKDAGARKTAARVRLAISSAKGAARNIHQLRWKAERAEGASRGRSPDQRRLPH